MRKLLIPAMFVWKTKTTKYKVQKHEREHENMVMLKVQNFIDELWYLNLTATKKNFAIDDQLFYFVSVSP